MSASFIRASRESAVRLPAWPGRTEFALSDRPLLTLFVRDGDLLRSDGGSIWITRDGHQRDTVLQPGDGHRVRGDGILRVSGFGPARLSVSAASPA